MLHVYSIRCPWELPKLCLCYHKDTAQGASGFKILKSDIHNLVYVTFQNFGVQIPRMTKETLVSFVILGI